jgi:hypothetical protein
MFRYLDGCNRYQQLGQGYFWAISNDPHVKPFLDTAEFATYTTPFDGAVSDGSRSPHNR